MWRLGPDHWRYRMARQIEGYRPLVTVVIIGLVLICLATRNPLFFLGGLAVILPIALPMAGLSCYRCSFNIFRRYRGPTYPEHGDSYTNGIKGIVPIPDLCPKCGARLLS